MMNGLEGKTYEEWLRPLGLLSRGAEGKPDGGCRDQRSSTELCSP